MPYSERLRLESEPLPDVLPPEVLLPESPLFEEELPEPVVAESAIVVPVDDPLVVSVVLPSFLEDEPDFAFVEDDLDPEAVVLLPPFLAEVVEPVVEPAPELLLVDPVPLVLPPLLLLLLLAVLPDDVDELGVLDVLPEVFDDSFEF